MTVSDGQKVALVVGAGAVVWLMTRKHTQGEVPLAIMDAPDEPGGLGKKDIKDLKRHQLEDVVRKLQDVAARIVEWNQRRQVLFGELQQANTPSQRDDHVKRLEELVAWGNELFAEIAGLFEKWKVYSGQPDPSITREHTALRLVQGWLVKLNQILNFDHRQKESAREVNVNQWYQQVAVMVREGDVYNQFNTHRVENTDIEMKTAVTFKTVVVQREGGRDSPVTDADGQPISEAIGSGVAGIQLALHPAREGERQKAATQRAQRSDDPQKPAVPQIPVILDDPDQGPSLDAVSFTTVQQPGKKPALNPGVPYASTSVDRRPRPPAQPKVVDLTKSPEASFVVPLSVERAVPVVDISGETQLKPLPPSPQVSPPASPKVNPKKRPRAPNFDGAPKKDTSGDQRPKRPKQAAGEAFVSDSGGSSQMKLDNPKQKAKAVVGRTPPPTDQDWAATVARIAKQARNGRDDTEQQWYYYMLKYTVPWGANGSWYDRHADVPATQGSDANHTYRAFTMDQRHLFAYLWHADANKYTRQPDEEILRKAAFKGYTVEKLESIRQSPEFQYWRQAMNSLFKDVQQLGKLKSKNDVIAAYKANAQKYAKPQRR